MNASLRDLRQHLDQTSTPPLDVEDIIARGDARLRRRRAALAAGSASLAVAVIVAVVALPGSSQRSGPPVDTPTERKSNPNVPTVNFTDVTAKAGLKFQHVSGAFVQVRHAVSVQGQLTNVHRGHFPSCGHRLPPHFVGRTLWRAAWRFLNGAVRASETPSPADRRCATLRR